MSAGIRARLDAMQARADSATPGPWEAGVEVGILGAAFVIRGQHGVPVRMRDDLSVTPDAEFIAAARTDLPALLAFARDVLDLHRPQAIYAWADDCEAEHCDQGHEHAYGEDGDLLCLDTPTGEFVCSECHDSSGEALAWPCGTGALAARHLGGEA